MNRLCGHGLGPADVQPTRNQPICSWLLAPPVGTYRGPDLPVRPPGYGS